MKIALLALISLVLAACGTHRDALDMGIPEAVGVSHVALERIDDAVTAAVKSGAIPGAAVEIIHDGKIVYRKAFGARALYPTYEANSIDTLYDLASMTKPIATTTAIMKLIEQGKIRLWDRVANYDPAFASHGKSQVTVEELLEHSAGLPSALNERESIAPEATGERIVDAMPLHFAPGSRYEYCNTCFIELAKIVKIASHTSLANFLASDVFGPLGIAQTLTMRPSSSQDALVSPEAEVRPRKYLRGQFIIAGHGPIGAVGHAGLFGTADAVAIYAQMLLQNGSYNGVRILSPMSVTTMIAPHYLGRLTQRLGSVRGLGWDEATTDSSNRGEIFGFGGFGHTGSTGCSLWIDPSTKTAVIFLSNAAHVKRDNDNDVVRLYSRVSTLAAASITDPNSANESAAQANRWSAQVAAQAAGFEKWSASDERLWRHTHHGTAY